MFSYCVFMVYSIENENVELYYISKIFFYYSSLNYYFLLFFLLAFFFGFPKNLLMFSYCVFMVYSIKNENVGLLRGGGNCNYNPFSPVGVNHNV
jgi:hypothetical protein